MSRADSPLHSLRFLYVYLYHFLPFLNVCVCVSGGEGGARRRLSIEAHYDKNSMAQAQASLHEDKDMPPPALNCLRVYFQVGTWMIYG